MNWEIISVEKIDKSDLSYYLKHSPEYPCILVQDSGKFLPIIDIEIEHNQQVPAIILSKSEFQDKDVWINIQRYHNIHELDLAVYSSQHPEIPIEVFMEILENKITYQSRDHWKEMSLLKTNTRTIGKKYGFKINVLRLFDRFIKSEREQWLKIWQKRNLKKNLIRDIINDYYDLDDLKRKEALKMAVEFETGWGDSKSVFPSDQLRDLVRQIRYPELTKVKKQVQEIHKKLNFPKGITLEMPGDFEMQNLQMKIDFLSIEAFSKHIQFLQNSNKIDEIKKLIDLL